MPTKFQRWCAEVNGFARRYGIEMFHERELRPYYDNGVSIEDTVKELNSIRQDYE